MVDLTRQHKNRGSAVVAGARSPFAQYHVADIRLSSGNAPGADAHASAPHSCWSGPSWSRRRRADFAEVFADEQH